MTAPQYNSNSLNCKKTAPQYNSNSLNCKNQEKANNSPSYRCAAIKNNYKNRQTLPECYQKTATICTLGKLHFKQSQNSFQGNVQNFKFWIASSENLN